ncbi:MAG: glycosyltransferase family 4 protein [Armatimonadetes bacterium]|nr:glycosyltransferase family 4 protein [Armatimonadota bacterium]
MRILFVNYEYPPIGGGGGVSMCDLAVELAKRHSVMVLTSGTRDLPRREESGGVNIVRLPVWLRRSRSVASLTSMASYVARGWLEGPAIARSFQPDVVNTWFALPSGPVGQRLARSLGCPNLLDLHGGDVYDPLKRLSPHRWWALRRVVSRLIHCADRVAAVSSELRDRAEQYYGAPAREVTVLPHGVQPRALAPATRADLGLPEDGFIISALGRLVPRKAMLVLIEALTRVADPRAVLLLIGDGPQRGMLEAVATRSGLRDRVIFCGQVEEERKYQLLMASDVFSLASLHEAFGVAYLEAMNSGLPVVTSPHGGQRDFVHHEANGLFVGQSDPAAYAAAWQRLMTNPDLHRRLSDGARHTAAQFTIAAMAAAYEALFQEMVEEHARRR